MWCRSTSTPHEEGEWVPGGLRAWRHRSLAALDADLRARVPRWCCAAAITCRPAVADRAGGRAVYWNRKYEPATQPPTRPSSARCAGIDAQSCNGGLLFEPWDIATAGPAVQGIYAVLAQCTQSLAPAGTAGCTGSTGAARGRQPGIDDLQLAPTLDWDTGFWEHWQPVKPVRWKHCPSLKTVPCAGIASSVTCRPCRDLAVVAPSALRRSRVAHRASWKAAVRPPMPTSTATCASWAGVTSPTTCCITSRRRRPTTSTRASTVSRGPPECHAAATGSAAIPACRSPMPACASCGTRLHAQPGADDRGQLPVQAPARALAAWRAGSGTLGRRRPGQ